ncbi:MAG: efflux transporter outer membrane subunit [Mongoliibacter sp.]|uniref:efflux transporter outer membrane subunit n=1 Tax=Mongoliibacter sp. TaxID=2022438 RepID=UPI0012EF7FAC|nr:efflux transporter outer membrane subunit [Mongoliibacter sp.]TVP43571.1 MAG: efflux transporter outer membrane subunit [Mongoliibacter sp.]
MKTIIQVILMVLLFCACKVGKSYKGVDVPIPTTYNATLEEEQQAGTDNINTLDLEKVGDANLEWWSLFDDPLLDTLIRTSLRYNRNVGIAAERIMQNRYALRIQNAEMLPKIGAQVSADRGNFLFNQIGQTNELFIAGTGLNWEIDFWGRLRNLSDAARYSLLASEHGLKSMQLSLISDVATTYFHWLQALEELEIAERNFALRDSMHQIIVARFEKGIIQQTDVEQSNILKNIAAGSVPKFRRKSVQLENSLNFLVGRNPTKLPKSHSLPELRTEMDLNQSSPVDLLKNRPDILEAEFQLMAQNAQLGAAIANRLPGISLNATLGIITDDFRQWDLSNPLWNIGGQLMGPLFFWGQLKRRVDIEQSKEYQQLFAYENRVLNALREMEDIKVGISTLNQELLAARERKKSALSAQFLSGERYSQGVTSYLEVLESQRQAFDAELALVQLQQSLLSAYVQFYKASGGGPIE